MPVSNASPLIYLAKIGVLGYLRDFYEDVQIPQEVKEEIVDRGMKGGYSDAFEKEILVDEAIARDAARQLGLIPHGTIYIILKLYNNGFITKEQAEELLDILIEKNFHVSARVYKKAMLALKGELYKKEYEQRD